MTSRNYIFLLILLVLFTCLYDSPANTSSTLSVSSTNHISVIYRSQETLYYCGPAVVQMALSYLDTAVAHQDQLAGEMQTDPEEGVTCTDIMSKPFHDRGFLDVCEDTLELADLKVNTENGHLTIILIHFSTAHLYQHYVLVVGYNASGIFVHDPWLATWDQPSGRKTGADVFISTELLADLWDCPSHWALVIPYIQGSGASSAWWPRNWLVIVIPAATFGIIVAFFLRRGRAKHEELE
ncbi:C39 family peptidase [Candidatus Bathyarchaeota archaeon]|nr:C39 family peptidase [Candidatus Bathyarchaeota archaeon]